MRGVKDFLVQGKEKYEEERKVGDKIIYLSSIFCDPLDRLKFAPVVSNPIVSPGYHIEEGELVFFKHTIFEEIWLNKNGNGPEKNDSQFLIDRANDIYRVPPYMIYAYTENGELKVTDDYVILKPIKIEDEVRPSGIIIPGLDKEVEGIGEITHIGKKLEELGYGVGDVVVWDANSEYEVRINNEKHYRMQYDWIIAKYEEAEG